MIRVLCIDDKWREIGLNTLLIEPFKKHGIEIKFEEDKEKVLPHLQNDPNVSLVLLDLKLPDNPEQGVEILKQIKDQYDIPVIVFTGLSEIQTAVECTKLGAYNYFTKDDITGEQLAIEVKHAVELTQLRAKRDGFEDIIRIKEGVRESPRLRTEKICKIFNPPDRAKIEALKDVSFNVYRNEFLVILGPSGCGKTTLLRILAGLEEPTSGKILMNGREIKEPGKDRGMVFQQYTTFPWLTVKENITFGLKLHNISEDERERLVKHYIKAIGLEGFQNAYPKDLSGGMQQRVAIARTLVNNPDILLMDEPFGALDAQTRWSMQELLLRVWQETRNIVIFVTHDVEEALFLADRIYISTARPGTIKYEIGVPFDRPRTLSLKTSIEFTEMERKILRLIRQVSIKPE